MEYQIIDANTLIGVYPTHHLDLSAERLLRDMETYRITASLTLCTIGLVNATVWYGRLHYRLLKPAIEPSSSQEVRA